MPAIPDWAIKPLVYGLAALALLAAGYVFGQRAVYEKWNEAIGEQAKAAVKIVTKQGAATERVVTEYRDRVQLQAGVNQTIEREVQVYVDSKPLALACLLDPGWIRLHDAAAAGAVPAAAVGPDDAGAGVAAAAALPTITGNYARYREVVDRLTALQAWIRAEYEATNSEPLGY